MPLLFKRKRKELLNQEKIDKKKKNVSVQVHYCYELKSLESDNRTTLVLSNTRELDRDLFTK